MALIESPELAARLARAIASDVILYSETQIQHWQGGPFPKELAGMICEGNELFVSRVAPGMLDGGRIFIGSFVVVFTAALKGRGRTAPPNLADLLAQTIGVSALGSSPPVAAAAPAPALTVAATSFLGGGTLSVLDTMLAFERPGYGGERERTEYAFADLDEVRVTRAASGCELSVRVRFSEQRFVMTAADAIAVATRLLPVVAR